MSKTRAGKMLPGKQERILWNTGKVRLVNSVQVQQSGYCCRHRPGIHKIHVKRIPGNNSLGYRQAKAGGQAYRGKQGTADT